MITVDKLKNILLSVKRVKGFDAYILIDEDENIKAKELPDYLDKVNLQKFLLEIDSFKASNLNENKLFNQKKIVLAKLGVIYYINLNKYDLFILGGNKTNIDITEIDHVIEQNL